MAKMATSVLLTTKQRRAKAAAEGRCGRCMSRTRIPREGLKCCDVCIQKNTKKKDIPANLRWLMAD
jgi:hypothetical protein